MDVEDLVFYLRILVFCVRFVVFYVWDLVFYIGDLVFCIGIYLVLYRGSNIDGFIEEMCTSLSTRRSLQCLKKVGYNLYLFCAISLFKKYDV